jgi:hypothetical protein
MIKLFPKPLLAVLTVLFVAAFVACDKDDDKPVSGKTELLSFGPTGALHGDTLKFIGLNLDKVTSIVFTGEDAVVDKAEFKSQTATLIKLLVPQAAEKGHVTLKTTEGDIVSKTQLNLGVMATYTDFTGTSRPADNITINGTYLNWVKSITFARDKVVTSFVSQSFEQLVIKVPDDAQTGPLVITYSGTDSGFYETEDTLKVVLPIGNAVAPGLLYHGENITITGTNLDLVKKVYFTNVAAAVTSFESQSSTELVVKVPPTALKGGIKIEAASGVQTNVPGEVDVKLPRATGIAPPIVKHLENITVTGTDLQLVKKIYFTNALLPESTFVSQSPTQIVVKVPGGAKKGTIKLEMPSGIQTTSAAEVDLLLPAITSFTPNPIDRLDTLTINGTNLNLVTAVVLSNSPPITTANFVSHSATKIEVKVPNTTANGVITLNVLNSTVTVLSATPLEITGGPPPPIISKYVYNEDVVWTGWSGGWGGTKDIASTAQARIGTKSVKITYEAGPYGSPFQLGGATVDLAGYTHFKISIYNDGAAGNKVTVRLTGDDEAGYQITLGAPGQWTDYSILISSITAGTSLTEFWIQEAQGKAYSIYVDEIGFN